MRRHLRNARKEWRSLIVVALSLSLVVASVGGCSKSDSRKSRGPSVLITQSAIVFAQGAAPQQRRASKKEENKKIIRWAALGFLGLGAVSGFVLFLRTALVAFGWDPNPESLSLGLRNLWGLFVIGFSVGLLLLNFG